MGSLDEHIERYRNHQEDLSHRSLPHRPTELIARGRFLPDRRRIATWRQSVHLRETNERHTLAGHLGLARFAIPAMCALGKENRIKWQRIVRALRPPLPSRLSQ